MSRTVLRQLIALNAERILDVLTRRQYVRPHQPVGEVLADAAAELGIPREAAGETAAWLQLELAHPVGRLRRTQLSQLARCLFRAARNNGSPTAPLGIEPNAV
jgi:hypothetical protein